VVLIALYQLQELQDFLQEEVVMVEFILGVVGGVEVEEAGVEQLEEQQDAGIP
jgi:hypothetical protein